MHIAKDMRLANAGILFLGALFVVLSFAAAVNPSLLLIALCGLLFFSFILLLPVTLVAGLVVWRKKSRWWLVPVILVCLFTLTPWTIRPFTTAYSDSQFRAHLKEYEAVVNAIGNQKIPSKLTLLDAELNKIEMPANVKAVRALRCKDGTLIVEFVSSSAGRVRQGYLFKGCDDALIEGDGGPARRYSLQRIAGQWYHFSD